jgi:transcriptional regulator with PAS, ATPase and Fis domain
VTGHSTEDASIHHADLATTSRPGVVVVHAGTTPRQASVALADGRVKIGRDELDQRGCGDARVSRNHVEIQLRQGEWTVTDLGSRNGTFVNGVRIAGPTVAARPRVVRIGDTLLLLRGDVEPLERHPVVVTETGVVGPALHATLERIRRLARSSETLLISGESGAGKELAAQTFHAAGPHAAGPRIAVNCATIPEGIAERLLFGAVRGAYSGADADAVGYVRAADRGVLFLDEVGELAASVQAKLLRVIESREVLPLGAVEPRVVTTRFCFATHVNLHAAVTAGRFRADLYHRVARTTVALPPLRERLEEVPWLVAWGLGPELTAHPNLIEAFLVRDWPGNVRELLALTRSAADEARAAGCASVHLTHLHEPVAADPRPPGAQRSPVEAMSADEVREVIDRHAGNLSAVARALGLHRSQLYRLLKRHGLR